jgi:predicted nucleotidyltransferase
MEDRDQIIKTLKAYLGTKVEFAYLFGSTASKRMTPESDIDIAVYLKNFSPDQFDRLQFITDLAGLFKRNVDVIILNDCDVIIAMQVLSKGFLILNENPHLAIQYKAQKISQYIDFKRTRKIVEDNLMKAKIYD